MQACALLGIGLWGEACASLLGTFLPVTAAVIEISFSYSILFSKLVMFNGTSFLVLSIFRLNVSVFQHKHACVEGGKVIREVEREEGLSGDNSCLLAEGLPRCN